MKPLPPTLMAQYHFTGLSGWRPYAGAGVNYTRFSDVDILDGAATVEADSWGFAYGAGVDVPMCGGWMINVDLKKVSIQTDVGVVPSVDRGRQSPRGLDSGYDKIGTFKIDPLLFSIGFGKRF